MFVCKSSTCKCFVTNSDNLTSPPPIVFTRHIVAIDKTYEYTFAIYHLSSSEDSVREK